MPKCHYSDAYYCQDRKYYHKDSYRNNRYQEGLEIFTHEVMYIHGKCKTEKVIAETPKRVSKEWRNASLIFFCYRQCLLQFPETLDDR